MIFATGVLAVLSFGRAPGTSDFDPARLTEPFGYLIYRIQLISHASYYFKQPYHRQSPRDFTDTSYMVLAPAAYNAPPCWLRFS